ncbi:hypothetical protein ALC57_05901 [Trachymyrmex cornetzi]|uniref:Uncharacterized protein n=1 Tax=Trachymyrmex cornetzi TaxID=471704 RepID=A0A151J9X3_9HYME|nr:hypothetical protein ALC57_05901 [Trachymyrmex cornetzi]
MQNRGRTFVHPLTAALAASTLGDIIRQTLGRGDLSCCTSVRTVISGRAQPSSARHHRQNNSVFHKISKVTSHRLRKCEHFTSGRPPLSTVPISNPLDDFRDTKTFDSCVYVTEVSFREGMKDGVVQARGNATPNAEFKIRPVCATGRKSLGGWCERSAVFPVQRTSQIYKHIEIFCRVSQSANNAGRTGGFIPIRIQDVGNSTILRRYILKVLETERRKGIFAMRTQKYFARSFLGRRKILNARRYIVVYMNACI